MVFPNAAHAYVVNGRTPLEWAVDRLHIRRDKESGIVNDPNAWFEADCPAELVVASAPSGTRERGDGTNRGAHCRQRCGIETTLAIDPAGTAVAAQC